MGSRKKQKQSQQSPLPSQYHFVPRTTAPPVPNRPSPPGVSDYPPPRQLFQDSHARTQAASAPLPQPSPSPPPQPRRSETSAARNAPSSSEAQDSASTERPEAVNPSLSDGFLRQINELISQPNRGRGIPILSPNFEPGTTWFGRDGGKLTRRISQTFRKKFDAAYYSWTVVPRDKQETIFIEFAKTHTWSQLHTGLVQQKFEEVCQRRMKDMVSDCRTKRKQPNWIHDTLWVEMTEYWDTPEAVEKSEIASAARLSERNGLGPHKHNTGQKSFQQIEYEMVEELGRPVSLGEVYIRTHTKKDGTYVDLKAEQVAEIYKKNKEAKLTALEAENSESSDGASNDPQLSIEEDNEIFLLSTFTNERGEYYGIGSLQQTLVNGKRKYSEFSSSAFLDLSKQLEEAHRKIEELAASNAARLEEAHRKIEEQAASNAAHAAAQAATIAQQGATIAEQGATIAGQAKQIDELAVVKKFLSATDHRFDQFVSTNSTT